jgi:hypothetical protein
MRERPPGPDGRNTPGVIQPLQGIVGKIERVRKAAPLRVLEFSAGAVAYLQKHTG